MARYDYSDSLDIYDCFLFPYVRVDLIYLLNILSLYKNITIAWGV